MCRQTEAEILSDEALVRLCHAMLVAAVEDAMGMGTRMGMDDQQGARDWLRSPGAATMAAELGLAPDGLAQFVDSIEDGTMDTGKYRRLRRWVGR